MEHRTQHLIVGSGMAGHAAAAAIRARDASAAIAMIGDEPHPPYARPPLSKGLWLGKPRESVFLPPVDGLRLHAGRRAVALDATARIVRDDAGDAHRYDRLLLATGGRPRRLAADAGRVTYLRTLADHDRLAALPGDAAVAVVGGGFVGSEIAAALAEGGRRVTLILPENAIGARVWPADLADFVTSYFERKGVRVLRARIATGVEADPAGRARVQTSGGEVVTADAVVAGLGIEPDDQLARLAGLAVDAGVLVDEAMRASAPGVFAAGDVARFPSAVLGGRVRVEHEDAAVSTGRVAGENMAGGAARYGGLPFFYSDLFDLGYEAVGRLDARVPTVTSWRTPFREGVVAYLDPEGRVRGVLLWGIFGQADAARALVGRRAPARSEDLAAALGG
jgi:NADPH-dependent 2,4-dienoyl-CoA reductase/sulfur reductase-like enzyme